MSLIINADDFGMFESANRGILYSLEKRLINSVSVCVNYPSEQVLSEILAFREQLVSLGLHINLTEGYSLISHTEYQDSLSLYRKCQTYEFFYQEIEAQVKKFNSIFGFLPEHLDCHQHYVYFDGNAYKAFVDISNKYNIHTRSIYVFSEKKRLEAFFLDVNKNHGLIVPFEVEKIVSFINSLEVKERSKCIVLNLYNLNTSKNNDVEVVCHPQLASNSEKNMDLKILERVQSRDLSLKTSLSENT